MVICTVYSKGLQVWLAEATNNVASSVAVSEVDSLITKIAFEIEMFR
tara:strand:- start:77 stop:217 length:141 start_codon:yes stop_codon:yes gene_type:complete